MGRCRSFLHVYFFVVRCRMSHILSYPRFQYTSSIGEQNTNMLGFCMVFGLYAIITTHRKI